ncbi:phosphoenolpyruvate--protein phosphotransferase [Acidomonas methanolica]
MDSVNATDTPPARRSRTGKAPQMKRLHGRGIVPGIVIAPVVLADEKPLPEIDRTATPGDIAEEYRRLDEAAEQSRRQIAKLRHKLESLPETGREEIDALLQVYERMLGRSRLLRGARTRIATGAMTAETAVLTESEALAALAGPHPAMTEEEQETAARRVGEFHEIARRLLRNLTGLSFRAFGNLPEGGILAVEQLRPADVALIAPTRFAAVLSESGGATDHAAIMLRALNIPAVTAVTGLTNGVQDGDLLIVDGTTGIVTVHPDETALAEAQEAMAAEARARRDIGRLRRLPAKLVDGETVTLLANMELPAELPQIRQNGAQGIGLLRSEFLFEEAGALPDEEAQYTVYASIVAGMDDQPVTIRVLDWGSDKGVERLRDLGYDLPEGGGGALGLRGLRLLLAHPQILETQFAAILRASLEGNVSVMLPMVTSVTEIQNCRDIYERVARRLRRRGIKLPAALPPLGIMVETPAAAATADMLVRHADFLSIGTNDLTMYTLAVDRGTSFQSELYSALHPGVLRLIATTVTAALRARRPISICGEFAADPRAAALLIGLGVRTLSMTPSAIPVVKRAIRGLSFEDCDALQHQALLMSDPLALRALLETAAPSGGTATRSG